MKTRSELKSESKELLKGHWGKSNLAQYHSYCRINHQHVADD